MTLNTCIRRIKELGLAHQQIKTFEVGNVDVLFDTKTTVYPVIVLQYNAANISISGKSTTVPFKMFIVDLVNVSEETKANEQDVLSDSLSIAIDMITQLNNPQFNDWKISSDNPVGFVTEEGGDMFAGSVVDFSVSWMFNQNICQIPSNAISAIRLMIDDDYFLLLQ